MKALVIGGGIFGVCAALELSKQGLSVDLVEQDNDLMKGATSVNQNRFHWGFHYPRSIPTAKQCQAGTASFTKYFGSSLVDLKANYYAIAKHGSRVSFVDYLSFCKNNNLPFKERYPHESLLDSSAVSGCIQVDEQIIDLPKFKRSTAGLINKSAVRVYTKRKFRGGEHRGYKVVVNASYSNFNIVNKAIGLPVRKFRYDVCNVPVLQLPISLSKIGLTIMDGNYYSILPYGKTPYHLFWSVKNSAIRTEGLYPPKNNSKKIADFSDNTYIPLLKEAKLVDVLRVIKILRSDVELSDERVTDLVSYGGGKFAILSAKLNTCVLTAQKLVDVVKKQNNLNG